MKDDCNTVVNGARPLLDTRRPRAAGVFFRARPLHGAIAGITLGLVCGLWLISLLTPLRPHARRQSPAVLADGRAESAPLSKTLSPVGAGEPSAGESNFKPAGVEAIPRKDLKAKPSAAAEPRRTPAEIVADRAEPERRQQGVGRCALSVSARSLSLRAGGSATITAGVDDLNGGGRVTAATNHWSDIAVFPESRGSRVKYKVISVSKRAGTFTVNFKSRCGMKSIPVIVTQS